MTGVLDGTVWSEIAGTIMHHLPGQEHPGKGLACHTYPRIGLGVLQQYVVARLILLDQVVLEEQRISLAVNDGVLDVCNLGYENPGLEIEAVLGHEILRDTLVQVLGLAYIDNIPRGVIISIDPGGMW